MEGKKLTPTTFIGMEGKGIISFGSGQPDLPPPEQAFHCLNNYRNFKYGLISGQKKLRKALAKKNPGFTEENFIITNGASEGLDLVLRSVCKPGDKVLIHKPYYYSYKPLIEKNYLIPVIVNTNRGKIVIEDFKQKVKDVKMVLINSPSNPSGVIQDISVLKKIEQITKQLNVILVSDEVYKDLIYERENYSLAGPHVVTINSFSKTFSMCGFRVGYVFSNDLSIIEKIKELKTHSSMNTSILAQEIAYHALQTPKSHLNRQKEIWRKRRDVIYNGLKQMGLDVWKPEGAFYVFPKIPNPEKFVKDMFEKHKVITYLGEWFGDHERVRFSYALSEKEIVEGLKRVEKYLKEENLIK